MRVTRTYIIVLYQALCLISEGKYSAADLLVNNYYHRHRRSAADFVQLLRLTKSHRAFNEASADTKNQLMRILFLLDPKHNHPTKPMYVDFKRKATADGVTTILFSIKEKKRTPAQ